YTSLSRPCLGRGLPPGAPRDRPRLPGRPLVLRFVTTADTEILATAAAVARLPDGFPEVRCANPATATDPRALVDELIDGARVVVCRILGGRRGWPEGFDLLRQECAERDVVLLA